MSIRPRAGHILVRVAVAEEKTKGGLIIPENSKEQPQEAVVIATGALGEYIIPGDKVLFAKFSGTIIRLDDEDLLLLEESDLLAVIDK